MYRRNFLVAAINLIVPVFICCQLASLWVFLVCYHFQFTWHKTGRKIQDWYLINSGSFCLYTLCMLQNISVLHLQRRENIFNGCPVIHISDSTMLMQEIVISFEEVMQTKLKVQLCIFQPLGNPCILQKRVVFQAKVFFSNSWFIVRLRNPRQLP